MGRNIEIQPVFYYYKAVPCMCNYLSKQENECSQAMKQAFKDSLENGTGSYEQRKFVFIHYATKRECPHLFQAYIEVLFLVQ